MLWFTIKVGIYIAIIIIRISYKTDIQVAELVGENSEDVWAHFESIAPTLDTLQQKCEGVGDKCINDAVKLTKYWEKVGTNLLELARKLKDHQLVSIL